MKLLAAIAALLIISIGFVLNFRNEALNDWQGFEDKVQQTSNEPVIEAPPVVADQVEPPTSEPTKIPKIEVTAVVITEDKDSPHLAAIMNPELDELTLITNLKDPTAFKKTLVGLIEQLTECIQESTCIEPDEDEQIPTYQLLERALYLSLAFDDLHPEQKVLSYEQASSLFEIENAQLQNLAIESLTSRPLSAQQISQTLAKAKDLELEARGKLFSYTERLTRGQENLRRDYINRMGQEINRDADSAVEILKYLQFTTLNENELAFVGKGLCRHLTQGRRQMIEFQLQQYTSLKGVKLELSEVCSL